MSLTKRWPVLLNWRLCFVLLIPVILLPIVFMDEEVDEPPGGAGPVKGETKFRCAYVLLIMALYWIVEVIPLAMTSFIPIVALPILGVQATKDVSMNYMRETNMLFVSGLIISAGVEYSNLNRRIALRVLTLVGSSPAKLVLGVMLTTMLLSMWMLNSAATSMMVPIVLQVVVELQRTCDLVRRRRSSAGVNPIGDIRRRSISNSSNGNPEKGLPLPSATSETWRQQKVMMLLGCCYASNLGGSGVVTGTTPNLVTFELLRQIDISQNGKYFDITFATWMLYAIPPMLLNTLFAWCYLVVTFLGFPKWMRVGPFKKSAAQRKEDEPTEAEEKESEEWIQKMLEYEYKSLGSISFHEAGVGTLFFIVVMLWFFRDPRFMEGWGEHLPKVAIGDSTAAMLIAILMFAVPRDPRVFFGKKPLLEGALLDWKYVQHKLPWDISLLMGAGFAISDASDKSGLSAWIGEQLASLSSLNSSVILIIVMVMTACVTEILSNAAAANLVIPILLSLSKQLGLHPLYLSLPACLACSFAFMLPVAAPSNGIVFAAAEGDMKTFDMVKTGVILNVICTLAMFLVHISYGNLLFNFDNYEYPPESNLTSLYFS